MNLFLESQLQPKGSPWGKTPLLSLSPFVLLSLIYMCLHTETQKWPDVEWMLLSLPPFLTGSSLFLYPEKTWTVFHRNCSPVSNEEVEGQWLIWERLWYYCMSFYIVILVSPWLFLALLLFWCSFPGVHLSLSFYSSQAQAEHLNLLESSFLTCQTALLRYQKIRKFLLLSPHQWQCVCQRTLWRINCPRPGKYTFSLSKIALRNNTGATGRPMVCTRVNTQIGWRSL